MYKNESYRIKLAKIVFLIVKQGIGPFTNYANNE